MMDNLQHVRGTCADAFEPVAEAFRRNFSEHNELGASCCLIVDGNIVVDLWGGLADTSGRPWERDSIALLFSCTKGALALCAHRLADHGELHFDKPVAHYWPEFARNDKSGITVGMLLSHAAGLPVFQAPVPRGGYRDWQQMTELLARARPVWTPGSRHGYHGLTLGWLAGELVRRIGGQSIGRLFATEIARPLGLDLWIGLPPELEARTARIIKPLTSIEDIDASPFLQAAVRDPQSPQAQLFQNAGGWHTECDTPAAHQAEIPAAGGIGNARSLAGMYAALAGDGNWRGYRLLGSDSLPDLRYPRTAAALDAVLLQASCFSYGFQKSWDNRTQPRINGSVLIGEHAFGHAGAGGSIGFADPQHGFAFAYVMNRHGTGLGLNARGQALVDAVYRCIGANHCVPGFWV